MTFKVACVQISSQNNMQKNIAKAIDFIEQAASGGADLIALPENVAFMAGSPEELFASAVLPDEHPALKEFQKIAKKLGKWVLIGSISVKTAGSDKLANRSFLIDDKGQVHDTYDKIHLYDVTVEQGESHHESDRYIAGDKTILADTPWCKMGLTICYDLRFPHLFRKLAQNGAKIIAVPSAFTAYTGKAHWKTLLRARAIETSCYIIAPAQTGSHPANRMTYGHSLIINPWGKILAQALDEEDVIMANVDLDLVDNVREQLPSLLYEREFS